MDETTKRPDGPAVLTASPNANGTSVEHLTAHIREQPLAAVALSGLVFFTMGILLGRR
jgi:hypothetical protein